MIPLPDLKTIQDSVSHHHCYKRPEEGSDRKISPGPGCAQMAQGHNKKDKADAVGK